MRLYAKTYINSLISISSIITVYYRNMTGGTHPGEKHDFWEFQYVDKGNYQIIVDGVRHDLAEGQLILFAPNAHHCSTGEYFDAQIGIVSFESDSPALSELCGKIITLSPQQRKLILDIVTEGVDAFIPSSPDSGLLGMIPREGVSSAKLHKLKGELELFLTEVYYSEKDISAPRVTNSSNYRKTQFEEIERYLEENLDKNLTLEDLSRYFSISPSKIKLIFREECKSSPIDYFTSLKVKKAQQLIRDTSLSFAEIAESLGFSYAYYFSKVFKQKTGFTPTEYLKSVYKAK